MRRSAHFPRFSAAVLLVATTALFAAPLVSAWEHLSHESAAAHGECEAWTVTSGHHADHAGQFEAAAAAHHEHHGVCQALSSLTGIPADAAGAARLNEAAATDAESSALLSGSKTAHPPSRGPPSRV